MVLIFGCVEFLFYLQILLLYHAILVKVESLLLGVQQALNFEKKKFIKLRFS